MFLGGAAWLVAGILGVQGQVGAFQRVQLPQGGLINLSHSGGYVVYYEAPGAASGQLPYFNITVAPASADASVASLQPYTADVTYSFGSTQGRAVLTVQISHPGTFRVMARGAPTVAGGSDLAFGSSVVGGYVGVGTAALLMGLGIAGGIALLIIRIVLTARRRAQMRVPPMQPQAWPPMAPSPGPQAGLPMGPPPGPQVGPT